MNDQTKTPDGLPGNHVQFGTNNAMEDYKPLVGHDDDGRTSAVDPAPQGAESNEANPGPHQLQGGMRS